MNLFTVEADPGRDQETVPDPGPSLVDLGPSLAVGHGTEVGLAARAEASLAPDQDRDPRAGVDPDLKAGQEHRSPPNKTVKMMINRQ